MFNSEHPECCVCASDEVEVVIEGNYYCSRCADAFYGDFDYDYSEDEEIDNDY